MVVGIDKAYADMPGEHVKNFYFPERFRYKVITPGLNRVSIIFINYTRAQHNDDRLPAFRL